MVKHRGFSLILIPVLILIIGVLGFSGWHVWSKNYRNDTKQIELSEQKPRFCGQRIWESEISFKVTCSVSLIFDDPKPNKAKVEEIIKPINGKISTEYEGLQDLGIYFITVNLGQEESASIYLQGLPGVIEAKQHTDSIAGLH